jgi:signal transduction histidine kinase
MVAELREAKEEVSLSLEKEKELGQLKSRFVSMASHEFRTPLSAVQLSAVLIEKYAQPFQNDHITKHVGKIKTNVGTLTAILNDFLSLEKLEAGKVEPAISSFDLVKLGEEITEEMQVVAKQNQNIIYQHTGINSIINLDQNLLKNCIVNLIANAIKYSGENTFIEFNTEVSDDKCTITIKDNGIGIPENDQKHLFEAFFRAHNTGNIPGTGLGLNIVARYTSLMNGTIEFKSNLNHGTLFILYFPIR